jgi:hypothetical protein
MPIEFHSAFYIKLGRQGGWEADSIKNGLLRLGWKDQSLSDISEGRWDAIEKQLRDEQPSKSAATTDLHALQNIVNSTPKDIWITFHQAKLWWTRVTSNVVQQDEMSKYRTTDGWRDSSISGRLLVVNDLPGKIAQIQGFRATVCRVSEPQLLRRVLEGTRSELAAQISNQRQTLAHHMEAAIRELHWKDYETLADLVFRYAGWERVSVLGQHAKAYDLELREPITGDRYIVQVKSQATYSDLVKTVNQFSADDFRKVFFVVHSPARDLQDATDFPAHVELVDSAHLARLALDAGLSQWLEEKVA